MGEVETAWARNGVANLSGEVVFGFLFLLAAQDQGQTDNWIVSSTGQVKILGMGTVSFNCPGT